MPGRVVKHTVGYFRRWLACRLANWWEKPHPSCRWHHPIGLDPRWNTKERRRKLAHVFWKLHSTGMSASFAAAADIRLQCLLPSNVDSHQGPSKKLPGLQPQTGAVSLISLQILQLPASQTDQLLGFQLSSAQVAIVDFADSYPADSYSECLRLWCCKPA